MKTTIATAALLAASAALSGATTLVFDLTGVGNVTSYSTSGTLLNDGLDISLSWSASGDGTIYKNVGTTYSVVNTNALAELDSLGISLTYYDTSSSSVTTDNTGYIIAPSYGAAVTSYITLSGFTAGETYTIVAVVAAFANTPTVTFSTGEIVSFAYYDLSEESGDAVTTGTSLSTETTTAYLIIAEVTADESGTIAISGNSKTGFNLVAIVPEPSAFGLLAGVGALAFAASRRRRRAK